MELLMTVAMIAILSGVAVAQYGKTVERGYWRSARDILLTIYAGEQVYSATRNGQYRSVDGTKADQWREIYMDNPNVSHIPVAYAGVTVNNTVNPPTFTATARRDGGRFNNQEMCVDQTRTLYPPAGSPPAGCAGNWSQP